MENSVILRPSYWASVSGGKDSLYMLNMILHNREIYPLDGVVHFELEIDYPFIKNVIDYMQSECERFGIKFLRIKPLTNWNELYSKYGFPTGVVRWCNDKYKLNAKKQLEEYMKSLGCYVVHYIGYCVDEEIRYVKRGLKVNEIYPLVEAKISENYIWEWAKEQPIFNNYYLTNKRCGCMYCPLASRISHAYLRKYYPENFNFMIEKMKETESNMEKKLGRPFSVISSNPKYNADYLKHNIEEKWLKILNEREYRNANSI